MPQPLECAFKVGNIVRISKYKIFFAKEYVSNWSEEVSVIKKVKKNCAWTYVISDFNGEEIVGTFYEKKLQKTNQKELRVINVIKGEGDKLFVKWKCYDNSFNSRVDEKYIFLEPKYSRGRVIVDLDLPNYATKADLKNATDVDTSKRAKKADLAI